VELWAQKLNLKSQPAMSLQNMGIPKDWLEQAREVAAALPSCVDACSFTLGEYRVSRESRCKPFLIENNTLCRKYYLDGALAEASDMFWYHRCFFLPDGTLCKIEATRTGMDVQFDADGLASIANIRSRGLDWDGNLEVLATVRRLPPFPLPPTLRELGVPKGPWDFVIRRGWIADAGAEAKLFRDDIDCVWEAWTDIDSHDVYLVPSGFARRKWTLAARRK
jgi:hypothetical protein